MVLAQDLRNAVLQAALQGELTKQLETDSSVDELLDKIRKKKIELMRKKNLKSEPILNEYSSDSYPFQIPQNWKWCQLGEIIIYQNGYAYKSMELSTIKKGLPVIKSQNIMTLKTVISDNNDYVESPTQKMLDSQIRKNDLLMCLSSQSSNPEPLGKTAIYEFDTPALLNQRVLKMTLIDSEMLKYIFYVINSHYFHYTVSHRGDGSAQSNLRLEHVREMLIPIPPIEEQQRIVDRVNELMEKIDEYERMEKELSALEQKIPDDMKNALLQAAMQGKLTEQLDSDSSVDEMLEAIKEEKKQLIKEKKIKKDKRLFNTNEIIAPFDIPSSWKWTTLGNLVYKLTDGTHKTPKYTESGVKFVSVKDMSTGRLSLANTKYISQEEHEELYERCNPEKGDILLSKVGTTGVPAIVDTDEQFSLFVSVALLKFNHKYINQKFFYYLIYSPLIQQQATENTKGIGNKNWVLDKIANTLVILPPIEEQQQIIEKLEQLLPLCETL